MKKTPLLQKRPLIYGIVGLINTAVDFFLFQLLYLFSPLAPAFCQAASYFAGISCSFILNRKFTFHDGQNKKVPKQMSRFLLVNGLSLTLSVLLMHLFYFLGTNTLLAKTVVTIFTAGINYFGYHFFVFKVKTKPKRDSL